MWKKDSIWWVFLTDHFFLCFIGAMCKLNVYIRGDILSGSLVRIFLWFSIHSDIKKILYRSPVNEDLNFDLILDIFRWFFPKLPLAKINMFKSLKRTHMVLFPFVFMHWLREIELMFWIQRKKVGFYLKNTATQ